jgi:hypothetical protein
LSEILAWRAFGFRLAELADLIDDREHDRSEAVRRQDELGVVQKERSSRRLAISACCADPDPDEPVSAGTHLTSGVR